MKIILFCFLIIILFLLIPERWISDVFMSHISISGDGEEAMDSYDFTVLLIKFSLSVLIAGLTLWASRFLKH